MHALLRILLMVALAVVTVSTAQHLDASQPGAHAAHSGHAHHGSEPHDPGSDHDPMTCCPSVSIHCGAGAVLCGEAWSPVERLTLAISPSLQDRAERVATIPEFEPPPPRS
jgi:hypothetical protein